MKTNKQQCLPCPKCGEPDYLVPSQSSVVGYVECQKCKLKGPLLAARPGTPESEFVAAVVHAWNQLPR